MGTLRRECLGHLMILGEGHLRKVLAEFARHYNKHRPHQSLHQAPPQRPSRAINITARIERRQVLGGLISEYCRQPSGHETARQRLWMSFGAAQGTEALYAHWRRRRVLRRVPAQCRVLSGLLD